MLLTTALLIAGGISAAAGLASSAGNIIAQHVNREDEQDFNAQEAEINRQFQSTEAATARQFNADEAEKARLFSAEEAQKSRMFSAEEAQKQRDYEKMMSDTAYQRQMADMKAAGLNPASVGLTSGASTPSGATALSSQAASYAASSSGVPGGSAASSNTGIQNPFNANYFSNLFSSGMQFAMAKDKSFTNKVIGEMYSANAAQMHQVATAIKTVAKAAGY